MKKRIITMLFVIFALAILIISNIPKKRQPEPQPEPIVMAVDGSLENKTIDDLIKESELIITGRVDENLPSKWKAPNGKIPKNLTVSTILEKDMSIITDHLVSINKILKGNYNESIVRVRSFTGEIDQVVFKSSLEPLYVVGQSYLIFLHKDNGPTQIVDPGDYIALNAIYGVYEIKGNKAASISDEWDLDELILYIQNKLSEPEATGIAPSATNISEVTVDETTLPIFEETATSTP